MVGGGGATGGGGGAMGGGGGATGGGAATGGGGATGGGNTALATCTFETPRQLAQGADEGGVAVLANGETIYAWRVGNSVVWRVQMANGTLMPQVIETYANPVSSGPVLRAQGNELLSVHASSGVPEMVWTRRYSGGNWGAVTSLSPVTGVSFLSTALESNGAAKVWQQAGSGGAVNEYVSTGAGFGSAAVVVDGGLLVYAATGAGPSSLILTIQGAASPAEMLFRDATGTVAGPLPDSFYDPGNLYMGAVSRDGTGLVVAGHFLFDGGAVIGGVGGTSAASTGLAPLSAVVPYTVGVGVPFRTLGVLAGNQGTGLVVWAEIGQTSISIKSARYASGAWQAAQVVVANVGTAVPRFSKLSDTQGVVHFSDVTNQSQRVEINVVGQVGSVTPSPDFPGVVYGTDYAASSLTAGAVTVSFLADAGTALFGGQCR